MVLGPFSSSIRYRVYYKDTDAGGIMYHSKYIEAMEMARTEYLRLRKIPPLFLNQEYNLLYPVTDLKIKYLKPAKYDDELTLTLTLTEATPIRVNFTYEFWIGEKDNPTLLTTAETCNVSVNRKTLRPQRSPKEVLEKLLS